MVNINIPIMMESVNKKSLLPFGNGNDGKLSKAFHVSHLIILLSVDVSVSFSSSSRLKTSSLRVLYYQVAPVCP